MATKRVGIRLAAEGGQQVRSEFQGVGQSGERELQRIERQADVTGQVLRRVFGILGTAVSVRQLVIYADTWSDLQSRVQLAVGSLEGGTAVLDRLSDMARRTYSSLEQTAEGWLQNVAVLRDLGMATSETLDFQEALNNALVVSGARAERATQVQNALSQAMALGALRGQQLNTVVANGGRVAELLAEELGVGVSELRRLGMEGQITGDVIQRALLGNLEALRAEADAMPATIGDAFTLMQNAALRLVGSYDQLLGASSRAAEVLILLADNLDRVAAYAITLGLFMGGRWVAAFVAARVATMSLVGALGLLRVALIRTGIGALVVLAGELVLWFMRLVEGAGGFGEAMSLMGELGRQVFAGMGNVIDAWLDGFRAMAKDAERIWTQMVQFLAERWADFLGTIAPAFDQISDRLGLDFQIDALGALSYASMLENRAMRLRREAEELRESERVQLATAFDGVVATLERIREVMAQAGETADVDLDSLIARAGDLEAAMDSAGTAGTGALERISDAAEEALQGWDAVLEKLDQYAEQATDWGSQLGDSLVRAFQSAEDAFAQMVTTGKADWRSLVTDMIADLARLGARMFIFGPLARMLMGPLAGLAGGLGGGAMGLGNLSVFDGGGHTGYGARTGGLDGMGGRLAMVHPRERIIDETRERRAAPLPVYVTIQTQDVGSFKRSRSQVQSEIARAVAAGQRGL